MVGDSGVGKSCLLEKLLHQESTNNFISTIGIDVKTHYANLNGQTTKLQVFPRQSLQIWCVNCRSEVGINGESRKCPKERLREEVGGSRQAQGAGEAGGMICQVDGIRDFS